MPTYKSLGESLLSALAERLIRAESRGDQAQIQAIRRDISDALTALGDSSPELSAKYGDLANPSDEA